MEVAGDGSADIKVQVVCRCSAEQVWVDDAAHGLLRGTIRTEPDIASVERPLLGGTPTGAPRESMLRSTMPVFCMRGSSVGIGSSIQLHLFEPRYKLMVQEAIEGNRQFCYARTSPAPGETALVMSIRRCTIDSSGAADIVVTATAKVALVDVFVDVQCCNLVRATVRQLPVDSHRSCGCSIM